MVLRELKISGGAGDRRLWSVIKCGGNFSGGAEACWGRGPGLGDSGPADPFSSCWGLSPSFLGARPARR